MVSHRNLASIVTLVLAVVLETQEALGGVVSSSNLISRAHSNLGIASTSLHDLKNVWRKESENDEQNSFIFDPKTTWAVLNRNAERQKKQRRRRRRRNRRKNELPIPKVGPPGPMGPRGPRGPPGMPGGTLSTDEMEMYIKSYVKEILDSRNSSEVSSVGMEDDLGRGQGRVRVAFTAQLPHPFSLPPKEITIVDAFTILFGPGQFERGVVLEDGGFAVTKAGLYHVSASLVLQPKGKSNNLQAKPYEQVSAHICVNNCNTDRRLTWLGTLHGDGGTTAHLSGHVLLLRGQKLLVAVDNSAKRKLRVDEGSTFSAALLGS